MRLTACALLVMVGGCPAVSYPRREPAVPPATPTPIDGLNTEWDDYNAAKPPGLDQIIFSTNRGSRGGDLDVWVAGVQWGPTPYALGEPRPYAEALMSTEDERGPLQMSVADFVEYDDSTSGAALAFSSARPGGAGGLDLYWARTFPAPVVYPLEHLSSPGNDAYMTTKFGGVTTPRVLFASDRFGAGYDIFEAQWDSYQIGGRPLLVRKVLALSTDADDTAPFVDSDGYVKADIVFASKRNGSWDLFCSHYDGTEYSAPVPITVANSEHDEFRPSVAEGAAQLLVFSSNRPGGKGGYDLYAVRFDGCTK